MGVVLKGAVAVPRTVVASGAGRTFYLYLEEYFRYRESNCLLLIIRETGCNIYQSA